MKPIEREMDVLLSSPDLVLCYIFQNCNSIVDVIALAATCQSLQSTWKLYAPSIIWAVAPRAIFAFDEALIAVRAIKLVKEGFEAGRLPSTPLSPKNLSGKAQKPSLKEFRSVLDLRHFVQCYYHIEKEYEGFGSSRPYGLDPLPENLTSGMIFDDNFHTAMYRNLIASALFTRYWHEPFAEGEDDTSWIREHIRAVLDRQGWKWPCVDWRRAENFDGDAQVEATSEWTSEQDQRMFACLKQYSVYNLEGDFDFLYEPFAQWLIDECRAKFNNSTATREYFFKLDYPPYPYSEYLSVPDFQWQLYLELEVSRMLFVHYHLRCMDYTFTNSDGRDYFDRADHEDIDPEKQYDKLDTDDPKQVRRVSVILSDIYQVEEVSMPKRPEDAMWKQLVTGPGYDMSLKLPLSCFLDLQKLSWDIYCHSGQPNRHNGKSAPYPFLQLFRHIMRKHLDLEFSSGAFDSSLWSATYDAFSGAWEVFSLEAVEDVNYGGKEGPDHIWQRIQQSP